MGMGPDNAMGVTLLAEPLVTYTAEFHRGDLTGASGYQVYFSGNSPTVCSDCTVSGENAIECFQT